MPLGEWTRRLGALPAEAYDCFTVGIYMGLTEYKHGSRRLVVANGRLPSDHRVATTRSQPAAVLALVKDKPLAALQKRRP